MQLPQPFVAKMQRLLGEEYGAFQAAFTQERSWGLRVNTLKSEAAALAQRSPWDLTPVPWCPSGYCYSAADQPGKYPWHAAGAYYLQDPSAMAVAELAAPQPGERVLDLCAAPGGKATHLAALMQDRGVLVANEVHPGRAKILAENLERWGSKHTLLTAVTPDQLAERFGTWFDCIVVDAPCSGEGMFRKDEVARQQWSEDLVRSCATTQSEILEAAYRLLAPGGRLIYSTCTFSPEENEYSVSRLLQSHPELVLESALLHPSWSPGLHQDETDPLRLTARLWPHRLRGEGHFLARLRKSAAAEIVAPALPALTGSLHPEPELVDFAQTSLTFLPTGPYLFFGSHVYQVLPQLPQLQGLRVLRPGWHWGEVRKGRFIPSHALALSLRPQQAQRCQHLSASDGATAAYLAGHTLASDLADGWALVCVDNFSLGWGKVSNGVLKNHYPKGLRVRAM